jgi:hypothetical protein
MAEKLSDRIRLPFRFDPHLLSHDLQGLTASNWIKHFVRQNYEGDWSVIPLRGKAGATHPVMMIYSDPTATQFEDTPTLKACPYFQTVLATFKCPLQATRLMRLTPGSVIKEHTDHELSVDEGTARIHVPIVTNPDVEFYLNGKRVVLEAGSVWYLRLSDPHRVHNKGAADRVHLVIDATVNSWLKELLAAASEFA